MARLAGQFAGILLVEVPERNADRLIEYLRGLEAEGLHVTVERGGGEEPPPTWQTLELELVGHDRPGIVRSIASALAARRVNIEELTTEVRSGAFSGESLFHAAARLRVPADVPADELRAALEPIANELMIDIALGRPGTLGEEGTR